MCSILVILCLFRRMIPDHAKLNSFDLEFLCILFEMLRLVPHEVNSQWKCEELDVIFTFIGDTAYGEVATCLGDFTNLVIERCKLSKPEWLHIIPLIHIFQKKVKPFERAATKSDSIQWQDNCIKLHLAKRTSSEQREKRYTICYYNQSRDPSCCILFIPVSN